MSSSVWSANTERQYVETYQKDTATNQIEIRKVGEPVCVEKYDRNFKRYECRFMLNFLQTYTRDTIGITQKGWFFNSEEKIGSEEFVEERTKELSYKTTYYRKEVTNFSQLADKDPARALAETVDNLVKMSELDAEYRYNKIATEAKCQNHHDFFAEYVGQKTVIPEDFRF